MKLEGPHGTFELSIVTYQFPQIDTEYWDANWLIVEGKVGLHGRSWTFRDPCLMTDEAERLAHWLADCASGVAEKEYCGFTEPNLQFDRTSLSSIRIGFALESAPPWATPGDDWTKHGFEVTIGPQLAIAAEQLRSQLAAFPVRGVAPPD